jgi:hypothetical protein
MITVTIYEETYLPENVVDGAIVDSETSTRNIECNTVEEALAMLRSWGLTQWSTSKARGSVGWYTSPGGARIYNFRTGEMAIETAVVSGPGWRTVLKAMAS